MFTSGQIIWESYIKKKSKSNQYYLQNYEKLVTLFVYKIFLAKHRIMQMQLHTYSPDQVIYI